MVQNAGQCYINEERDLLKAGLMGIAKQYGFQAVHDFVAKIAYADYWDKAGKWEENYRENAQNSEKESIHKQLQNYKTKK